MKITRLLNFLFGCHHRNLSRVFTIRRRTYRVCCDCGAQFDYSLDKMAINRRQVQRPQPDLVEGRGQAAAGGPIRCQRVLLGILLLLFAGPDVRSSFSDCIAIPASDHHASSAASEWRHAGSRRSSLRSVGKGKWNNLCRPDQVAVRRLNHLVCRWT